MLPQLKIEQINTKPKVYEDIVAQIKRWILAGDIREGNRLPTERELATRFGVSRVSVRQALTVLHEMGLLESRPGGGTILRNAVKEKVQSSLVKAFIEERELLWEPLEVRRIIEPEVTRIAAARATQRDIADMKRIINLQEAQAKKGLPITEEDTLFHEAIAKITKNTILLKLVQSLNEHLRASRERSLTAPNGTQRSIQDHKKILEAVSEKDEKKARQAMMQHLKNVEGLISKTLRAKN